MHKQVALQATRAHNCWVQPVEPKLENIPLVIDAELALSRALIVYSKSKIACRLQLRGGCTHDRDQGLQTQDWVEQGGEGIHNMFQHCQNLGLGPCGKCGVMGMRMQLHLRYTGCEAKQ